MASQTFTAAQVLTAAQMNTLGDTVDGYTTTATAAGTSTQTVASKYQQFYTGSTTQSHVMPDTTTLVVGWKQRVVNNSSGIVTVQSSGANTVYAVPAGGDVIFTCILASGTTAASWDYKNHIATASTSILYARKTANQTVTSNTTVANDNHLTFAVAANEVWSFDLWLSVIGASAGTANFKMTMNGPSGATILWSFAPQIDTSTAGTTQRHEAKAMAVTDSIYADNLASVIGIKGTIVNGANAGSCTLQWAQDTSNANGCTIYANSTLIAIKGA